MSASFLFSSSRFALFQPANVYLRRKSDNFKSLSRALTVAAAFLFLCAASASATTFNVTDNSDDPTDTGSLRYAVNHLATGSAVSTNSITIPNNLTNGQTITLVNGALALTQGVTITGPGANQLIISGNHATSVFTISAGASVSISGATIANADTAISSTSGTTVTISGCIFTGNSAGSEGNSISSRGTATVTNSTFELNSGLHAVANYSAMTAYGDTFYQNSGGGFFNGSSGVLAVANSTFSANSTAGQGGAIDNQGGTLAANNSLFASNSAAGSDSGAAIYNASSATANARYNVYWNNLAGGAEDDCEGCSSNANATSASANPLLAPAYYGGSVETMLPVPGSAAICAGSYALLPAGITTDLRGYPISSSCTDAGADQTNYMTVTKTANTSDGDCTTKVCSLLDAVSAANAAGFGDIDFAAKLKGETISIAPLQLTGNANLIGPGAGQLMISPEARAYGLNNYLFYTTGESLFYGLSFAGVFNPYNQGALDNTGQLTLSQCTVKNNSADFAAGIYNSGQLTVIDSLFENNEVGDLLSTFGGAILNGGGQLTVIGSTFANNIAAAGYIGYGGAISSAGPVLAIDSTFTGNYAEGNGGAIYSTGPVTLIGSTITGNNVYENGGGIYAGSLTLANSIVAGNSAYTYADIDDESIPYTDNGGNLASDNVSPTSTIDAQLSPLQLNGIGAPFVTVIPLPGSPAICAGELSNIPPGVTTDERGYPNINTTYTGYSAGSPCVDSGAVQTDYTSVAFVQQPSDTYVYVAILPSPTVEVLETDANLPAPNNTDTVGGVPVTLSYSGGSSEMAGALTETTAPTAEGTATANLATFKGLAPNTVGTGFTLSTDSVLITGSTSGPMLSPQTSDAFNVNATFLPALTAPVPGTTLPSGNVQFTWNPGEGDTGIELKLGTSGPGAMDLYDGGVTAATTATVSIPANGVTVFATLVYHVNGVWNSIAYTYTESGSPTLPSMISPTPGSTISGSQTFTWNPGAGATLFELKLSTGLPGANNLYNGAASSATSATVNIPANGVTLYAALVYHLNGVEYSIPYTYMESGSPTLPSMISPTPGSTLSGSQTFTWNPGAGPTLFELKLSTGLPGANNLYNGAASSATSATVNIPANGVTLYAALVYHLNGVEYSIPYTYKESGSPTLPSMISPTQGSTLAATQTFTWNSGAGPGGFELKLGTTPAAHDIYNGVITNANSETVAVPSNAAKIYASLVYHLNGVEHLIPYTYMEP